MSNDLSLLGGGPVSKLVFSAAKAAWRQRFQAAIAKTQDGGARPNLDTDLSVGKAVTELLGACINEAESRDELIAHLRYAQDQIGRAIRGIA